MVYSILRETSIDGTGWSPARRLKVRIIVLVRNNNKWPGEAKIITPMKLRLRLSPIPVSGYHVWIEFSLHCELLTLHPEEVGHG